MTETQISAYISPSTKRRVERYAAAHGVKKGHLMEEALLHHLQALEALPADLVIPPQLVVAEQSFAEVASLVGKPRRRSKALKALLQGERLPGEPVDW